MHKKFAHHCFSTTSSIINTFSAAWRIYASYVQMHRVLNDTYMRHSIEYAGCGLTYINTKPETFRTRVCLQLNFPKMIFIPKHINLENFIQTDHKLLELWS